MVYGGTIKPGKSCTNQQLDVVSAFQSYSQYISGTITEAERMNIVANSCPGADACGGMYIANTVLC
jgi:dihydroxy-acid dehydratase